MTHSNMASNSATEIIFPCEFAITASWLLYLVEHA